MADPAPGVFPLLDHCRSLPGTTEDIKWENDLVFSVGAKMYAVFDPATPDTPSFKCDPYDFARLSILDGVRPAAYLARAGWVHLERPDALPLDELKDLLTKSHDLVLARLPKTVQREIAADARLTAELSSEGALTARGAPIAQEPLDLGDQLVAGRQALLVDHRLEPLDVRPGRLVGAGRQVEPRAQLAGLLLERDRRDLDPEMPLDRAQQRQGGHRVRPGDVMGDLGEVAERRDAGLGQALVEDRQRGRGHAQDARRARVARRRAAARAPTRCR